MSGKGLIAAGLLIIIVGVMLLASQLLKIGFWPLFFAAFLVVIGIGLLLRPRMLGGDTSLRARILGPVRYRGVWQAQEKEIWLLIGDVRLDFSEAEIPIGETPIRVFGFVVDLRAVVPEEVGVAITSSAIISDARLLGQGHDRFFQPVRVTSESYEVAERRIKIEVTGVISNIRVQAA